jgi:hypothetical protein
MSILFRLQLVGPVVLFCAALAAESAAYALTQAPSSGFLWYLNLEVFNLFRRSRIILGQYCDLPFAHILMVAGPMALLGLAGLALKRNLCLAVSSNLGFIYAAFLAYSWFAWNNGGRVTSASLASVYVPTGDALYLFVVLAITALVSFAASHCLYFRALRSEA